jgi:hypothetical protein
MSVNRELWLLGAADGNRTVRFQTITAKVAMSKLAT